MIGRDRAAHGDRPGRLNATTCRAFDPGDSLVQTITMAATIGRQEQSVQKVRTAISRTPCENKLQGIVPGPNDPLATSARSFPVLSSTIRSFLPGTGQVILE